MSKHSAVIGSNFGDEGKGITVANIAKANIDKRTLNVRFNGGHQAGHTVEFNGDRHVFKGYGSATFLGADTFFSEDFIFNPYFFLKETYELKDLDYQPIVYMSKKTIFTTPIDAMVNMAIENLRGSERHGSVGVGIFETIKRCEKHSEFTTFYDFITKCNNKVKWFDDIVKIYIPERLCELGFNQTQIDDFISSFDDFNFILRALQNFSQAAELIEFVEFDELKEEYDFVIFEGAQGLLLDQENYEYFPHLTPSNCGIKNILKLLDHNEDVDVFYATRPYLTRHGAGLFKTEVENKEYISSKIEDLTNIPNQFQETLRFGLLDINELLNRVNNDLLDDKLNQVNPYFSLSCIDQIDEKVPVILNGMEKRMNLETLIEFLEIELDVALKIDSPSI